MLFIFNGTMVAQLIEHAQKAKLHIPTYDQSYEMLGDDWIEGKVKAETIMDKIPAGLHLVKDQGVYLMSNGDSAKPVSETGLICYAEGFGTDGPHIGGDDFVEHVPLTVFGPGDMHHLKNGTVDFSVTLSEKELRFGFYGKVKSKEK
jgi:hypothetical protein